MVAIAATDVNTASSESWEVVVGCAIKWKELAKEHNENTSSPLDGRIELRSPISTSVSLYLQLSNLFPNYFVKSRVYVSVGDGDLEHDVVKCKTGIWNPVVAADAWISG